MKPSGPVIRIDSGAIFIEKLTLLLDPDTLVALASIVPHRSKVNTKLLAIMRVSYPPVEALPYTLKWGQAKYGCLKE